MKTSTTDMPTNPARIYRWLKQRRTCTITQVNIALDLDDDDAEAGLEWLVRAGLARRQSGRHPKSLQPITVYKIEANKC